MKVSYVRVLNAKKLNLVLTIREMIRQVKKALYPTLRGRMAEYCTRYITGGAVLREVSTGIYRKGGQAPKEEFYMGYQLIQGLRRKSKGKEAREICLRK